MSEFQRETSETPEPDTDPDSTSSSVSGVSGSPAYSQTSSQSYGNFLSTDAPVVSSSSTRHLRYYNTSSHSSNPLRDPAERSRELLASHRESLEACRAAALATIADCHNVVTGLELSRLTGSRVGYARFLSFWGMLYDNRSVRLFASVIRQAQRRIEPLFRDTASRLHTMLNIIRNNIRLAATEAQIRWELQLMEEYARSDCEERCRKAARIMRKMRRHIQNATGLAIDENKLTDMKRAIFSLDVDCNYYPHTLADEQTAVALPPVHPLPLPFFEYDPRMHPRRETILVHNGRYYVIAPGYRPIGDYQLETTRLG